MSDQKLMTELMGVNTYIDSELFADRIRLYLTLITVYIIIKLVSIRFCKEFK